MTTHLLDVLTATAFAQAWIQAWNAHDLDAILDHYDDEVVFTSPFVVSVTGVEDGTLNGKPALREYFSAALARYDDIHFRDLTVHTGLSSVTLHYICHIGGADRGAVETMLLDRHRAVRVLCHYNTDHS